MSSLLLAGNKNEATGYGSIGHLQLVFQADGQLSEIEVQGPPFGSGGQILYDLAVKFSVTSLWTTKNGKLKT